MKKIFILIILWVGGQAFLNAQDLKGRVISKRGEPIADAYIIKKGQPNIPTLTNGVFLGLPIL